MVDNFDQRPVYKQDGGENYIYFRFGKTLCEASYNIPIAVPDSVAGLLALW